MAKRGRPAFNPEMISLMRGAGVTGSHRTLVNFCYASTARNFLAKHPDSPARALWDHATANAGTFKPPVSSLVELGRLLEEGLEAPEALRRAESVVGLPVKEAAQRLRSFRLVRPVVTSETWEIDAEGMRVRVWRPVGRGHRAKPAPEW